jgi:glyoxylase-like metal-dependent hydrolase (beta-lactamase superfamily II)
VGSIRVGVLLTTGHTPGSLSLRVGGAVISGDTLFRGGPGKTFAAGDLETIVATIESRLLPLPPATLVLPGHGADTDIATSRRGVEAYRRSPKPPRCFGDVEWPPAA